MVGGGTVFGPQPRSYRLDMPRKMRRLALRSALSVKASEGQVLVVDGFGLDEPNTKTMVSLLRAAGVETTALVVLAAPNLVVAKSLANLPWAKSILAHNLNLYDLFTHDHVVIARDALELIEETFGGARAVEVGEEPEAAEAAGAEVAAAASPPKQAARRAAKAQEESS